MHDYFLSVLLGIIEGLTEFLPVSSTAHLRISEALLGLDLSNGYWKMYSIVIQLGAILCLPIYFRSRISDFLRTFPHGQRNDRTVMNHPLTLVLVAFVFTAIPSYLLTKVIGEHLESRYVMGISLLAGGIIMWIVDALFGAPRSGRHKTEHMEEMSLFQAIWIGICQIASAVFPGTSRSGGRPAKSWPEERPDWMRVNCRTRHRRVRCVHSVCWRRCEFQDRGKTRETFFSVLKLPLEFFLRSEIEPTPGGSRST